MNLCQGLLNSNTPPSRAPLPAMPTVQGGGLPGPPGPPGMPFQGGGPMNPEQLQKMMQMFMASRGGGGGGGGGPGGGGGGMQGRSDDRARRDADMGAIGTAIGGGLHGGDARMGVGGGEGGGDVRGAVRKPQGDLRTRLAASQDWKRMSDTVCVWVCLFTHSRYTHSTHTHTHSTHTHTHTHTHK